MYYEAEWECAMIGSHGKPRRPNYYERAYCGCSVGHMSYYDYTIKDVIRDARIRAFKDIGMSRCFLTIYGHNSKVHYNRCIRATEKEIKEVAA